jgi:Zn ribbon nucleic-acid-binding protein
MELVSFINIVFILFSIPIFTIFYAQTREWGYIDDIREQIYILKDKTTNQMWTENKFTLVQCIEGNCKLTMHNNDNDEKIINIKQYKEYNIPPRSAYTISTPDTDCTLHLREK